MPIIASLAILTSELSFDAAIFGLDEVATSESTRALVRALRERRVRTALISSATHFSETVERAGLASLFDTRVDGLTVKAIGPQGMPDPATFDKAAEKLDLENARCIFVGDTIAGVRAGRGGAFGLVIGVDRHHARQALLNAGAHMVVSDLAELDVNSLDAGFPGETPNALDALPEIARRLGTMRLAVFLDYDGTLTPIVDRPELAVLSDDMRATLTTLARHCPTAIISGRSLDDVKALVGIEELFYTGNHGFELEVPGSRARQHRGGDHLATIARAARSLEPLIAPIDGAFIENKQYSLSVHYRLAPADCVAEIKAFVDEAVARLPLLRTHQGKMVFEIRPRIEWDKGKAVQWLLEALDLDTDDVLPIYIGDDATDEDAFRTLLGRGIGVLVTNDRRPTAALYTLRNTAEVLECLEKLVKLGT